MVDDYETLNFKKKLTKYFHDISDNWKEKYFLHNVSALME